MGTKPAETRVNRPGASTPILADRAALPSSLVETGPSAGPDQPISTSARSGILGRGLRSAAESGELMRHILKVMPEAGTATEPS